MELVSLNCTALLIPTPGQTEQEYLADYLSKKGWFFTLPQNHISTELIYGEGKVNMQGEVNRQSKILLANALKEISDNHH
jgi:predicted glycosyltransferase